MSQHLKNIFLTGPLHIGKSTIINKVIQQWPEWKIGGFRTRPVFDNAQKCGFIFQSFDGQEDCFAHTEMNSPDQFDVYHYDANIFETLGCSALGRSLSESDLIVMDEIGVMEIRARQFQQMIVRCLDAPVWVIGAFQQRADWFRKLLANRSDTVIFEVDSANRDELVQRIIALLHNGLAAIKFLT